MENASTLEWLWTGAMLGALLFSSLYMARLVVRGLYMWQHKENGLLRAFWSWQTVVTVYFVLSTAMWAVLGVLAMFAPPPEVEEISTLEEVRGYALLLYAFAKFGVQWFIWVMDRNTVERATLAERAIEAAAKTIAIVEANTEAVEANTSAVQENTEQTKGA